MRKLLFVGGLGIIGLMVRKVLRRSPPPGEVRP